MLTKALILSAVVAAFGQPAVTTVKGCYDIGAITTNCPIGTSVTFTIGGTSLANPIAVTIGGRTCSVVTSAANQITCTYTGLPEQNSQSNGNPNFQAVVVQTAAGFNSQTVPLGGAAANSIVYFREFAFTQVDTKTTDPCAYNTLVGAAAATPLADCSTSTRDTPTVLLPAPTSQESSAYNALSTTGLQIPVTISGVSTSSAPADVAEVLGGFITFAALVNGRQTCNTPVATAAGAYVWPLNLANSQYSFTIPPTIISAAAATDGTTYATLELEAAPRQLCWLPGGSARGRAIGAAIKVVWDCDPTVTKKSCSQIPVTDVLYNRLNATQILVRQGLTTCCRNTNPATVNTRTVGQCINPNMQSCCGSSAYIVGTQRCCNPGTATGNEIVVSYTQACPCTTTPTNTVTCPAGETCCVNSKYPELGITAGICYNPQTHKCCNTGERYDPGSQQCCRINGLQSLDVPCPCSSNDDCQFGGRTNFACCKQTSPALVEDRNVNTNIAGYSQTTTCNIYQSYPSGTGPATTQRCSGSCINVDYQICCNGVACIKAFEKCCNATCCNQFVGSCNVGIRSASQGNPNNFNEFRVTYLQCTTIEHMHELKAFWIFVWPTFLLMMTLGTLALVVIFANKASGRSYSALEHAIITAAILAIIFSLSLFFSPMYKYGMVVIFAHLLAILTAGVRVRSLNVLTVVVFTILVIYLFDPFHGNAYLTLAENRNLDGTIDRETMGIWHTTFRQWKTLDRTRNERWCTNYYNYFRLDDNLRDVDRFDNPLDTTWGYCNRGWVFALLMFEGFIILATLVNFVLGLVAVLVRFQEKAAY